LAGFPGEHSLRVDDRGHVQSVRGDSQLPWLLGNLSQLMLDPLPETPAARWEESNRSGISVVQEDGRFPRPHFGIAPRDERNRMEARESARYSVETQQ